MSDETANKLALVGMVALWVWPFAYIAFTEWLDRRAGRYSRWLTTDQIERWKRLGGRP